MKTLALSLFFAITAPNLARADDDYLRYSDQAQAVLDADRCASNVVEAAASEVISRVADAGVDYPDYLYVDSILALRPRHYRIIVSGMAMLIDVTPNCVAGELVVLQTIHDDVRFDSEYLDQLAVVAGEVLGEEFFGPSNIGGAHKAASTWFSENPGDAASLVKAYYREWHELSTEPVLRTDESEAAIKARLELMNIKAQFDGDAEAGAKAAEILDLVMKALADKARYKVVVGRWTDAGIGDPYADYLAIVDEHLGEFLILEQGFVD